MFVEVSNSSYAATRNPADNRKSQSGNSAAKASWRNMELNRGCEVKRETLNLVVSPVISRFGWAKAVVKDAGKRGKDAKDEYLPTAPGSQTASSSTL
jgi:hypothetical protein